MPFSQFIDAGLVTRSVNQAIDAGSSLLQLQRTLREQDRKNAFDQQADPYRLASLRASATSALANAAADAATVDATILSRRANAALTDTQAWVAAQTAPAQVTGAYQQVYGNAQNLEMNAMTLADTARTLDLKPQQGAQGQAMTFANFQQAGVDTSNIPKVDYLGAAAKTPDYVGQAKQFNAQAAPVYNSPMPALSGKYVTPASQQAFAKGDQLAYDLANNGPVQQLLASAGIPPSSQQQLIAPYMAAKQVSEAIGNENQQLAKTVDERDKQLRAMELEIYNLKKQLATGGAPQQPTETPPQVQAADAAAADAVYKDAVARSDAGLSGNPNLPNKVAAVDPTAVAGVTIEPTAPITPMRQRQLLPVEEIPEEGIAKVSTFESLIDPDGSNFRFAQPPEPPIEVGVSEPDTYVGADGYAAPSIPVIDPRSNQGQVFQAMMKQESTGRQFRSDGRTIVSGAGAVGIAQLMPGTAKDVAKKHGIPYSRDALYKDANYNARLGKLYFDDLMKEFKNTTIAIAAYNMGGGNARNAIRQLGDPRKGEISEAEWVRRLPTVTRGGKQLRGLAETRDYVSKVYGYYRSAKK